MELYSQIKGAVPRITERQWIFKDRKGNVVSKISFKHLERDADVHAYQGGQICALFYDELTHFSEYIFFYMLSRNRSSCGVSPYIRATCNPDPDSWVRKFIDWWIGEDGFPIKERSGEIRYMVRISGEVNWGDSREELWERFNLVTQKDKNKVKSVTFIPALLEDNPALMRKDPGYRANLENLPEVERMQLLYGNWNIRRAAGLFFRRSQVNVIDRSLILQRDIVIICRAWDLAATAESADNDPDYTAGVLMALMKSGRKVVLDVINQRVPAGEVENLIYNTTVADSMQYGFNYRVRIPQDPGAAGKIVADSYVKRLSGYSVIVERVTGSKENRATPFAAQWQNGNVDVVAAPWNDMYFRQLESFPEGKHDDMVDGSSDAFNEISKPLFDPRNLT